jgi:hypothetical protein
LIIYNANIANQFHQEFSQRFKDLLTPVTVDDDIIAYTNEWMNINYLDNDFIPEEVVISKEIVQLPFNGVVDWVEGEMDYKSNPDYIGMDSLSYRIYNIDNIELSDTAWVRIEVIGNAIIPLAPIAVDDMAITMMNDSVFIDYLENDTIPFGVTVVSEIVNAPNYGEVGFMLDEMYFVPADEFTGNDSLSYRIYNIENTELSDTAWVRIEVGENSIEEFSARNFTIAKQFIKQGVLYLDVFSRKNEELNLSLFNINGKLIFSSSIKINTGSNDIQIELRAVSKSVYLLELSSISGRISSKLVY